MRPRHILAAVTCLLAASLSSCGGPEAAAGRYSIAVIPKGTSHEFWKSIHAGALVTSRELGVDITWKGPQVENDRDGQIKVVEDFITKGVDGIVIAPMDDKALARPLQDAADQGIPVIVIDSDVDWDGRVSFIATDNYASGRLAGEELGRRLEGEGRVILLRYQVGSASTSRREQGFLDAIAGSFPDIEVLSSDQYAGATLASALAKSEDLLQKFPDVDGIFCPNESAVNGMHLALEQAGRAGTVRLVGFDATEKLVAGLRSGGIDALVVQDPYRMGAAGLRRMVAHLDGEEVEPELDTGAVVVTLDNLEDPQVSALLNPDLSVLE